MTKKPVWVKNIKQSDSIDIIQLDSTGEWLITLRDEDGYLEDGFKTEKEVEDRLDSLGLSGWY